MTDPTNAARDEERIAKVREIIRDMVTDCYMRDEDGNFTPVWWDESPLVGEIASQIDTLYVALLREARIDELKLLQEFLTTAHLYDQDAAMKLRWHFDNRLAELSAGHGGE